MKVISMWFLSVISAIAVGGNENSATTLPNFGWELEKFQIAACAGRKLVYPLAPHVLASDDETRFTSRKLPAALALSERGELYGILDAGVYELTIHARAEKVISTASVKISVVNCRIDE